MAMNCKESGMESKANNELSGLEKLYEEKLEDVISTNKCLKSQEKRLVEVQNLIGAKERECGLIEKRIGDGKRKLKWIEKFIQDKELKLGKENSIEKALKLKMNMKLMEEQSKELELKQKELEFKERQVVSKSEKLDSIDKRVHEQLTEVQLKEKHLASLSHELQMKEHERTKHLDSLSHELQMKERQLKQHAEEIESLKNELNIEQQKNYNPGANHIRDGKDLQLFMYEHMKRNDLMSDQISALLLQQELCAPNIVLDAMQWFHRSNSNPNMDNRIQFEFDLVLIRRSCILLLEELKRVSLQISPQVRTDALKLAFDWKAKMAEGIENWMEILGFLKLVDTYELASDFDVNELQTLLDKLAQQEQKNELSQALVSPYLSNEKPESPASSPPRNLQISATTITRLQGIVQNLIRKRNLTEAFGLIITFKLFDKFPPEQVLREYVENANKRCLNRSNKKNKSLDEKDKFIDEQVADLRIVLRCMEDYNLKSEIYEGIQKKIGSLKQFKRERRLIHRKQQERKNKRCNAASNNQTQQEKKASDIEQEQQNKGNKRMASKFHPHEELQNKFQRTSISTARPPEFYAKLMELERLSALRRWSHAM